MIQREFWCPAQFYTYRWKFLVYPAMPAYSLLQTATFIQQLKSLFHFSISTKLRSTRYIASLTLSHLLIIQILLLQVLQHQSQIDSQYMYICTMKTYNTGPRHQHKTEIIECGSLIECIVFINTTRKGHIQHRARKACYDEFYKTAAICYW